MADLAPDEPSHEAILQYLDEATDAINERLADFVGTLRESVRRGEITLAEAQRYARKIRVPREVVIP
jgi:hypothetical protein